MKSKPLDLPRLLRCLAAEPRLQWVLIGGLAVAAHGGTRMTIDIDLAIAFNSENRRAIVRALAPLNPLPVRKTSASAWVWDEFSVRAPGSIFETDAGPVDLIVRLAGIDSFYGLYTRSEVHNIAGAEVRIASIDDLIAMKRTANRDRDREDVQQLLAIQRLKGSA